jgi:hypothetical protein
VERRPEKTGLKLCKGFFLKPFSSKWLEPQVRLVGTTSNMTDAIIGQSCDTSGTHLKL